MNFKAHNLVCDSVDCQCWLSGLMLHSSQAWCDDMKLIMRRPQLHSRDIFSLVLDAAFTYQQSPTSPGASPLLVPISPIWSSLTPPAWRGVSLTWLTLVLLLCIVKLVMNLCNAFPDIISVYTLHVFRAYLPSWDVGTLRSGYLTLLDTQPPPFSD